VLISDNKYVIKERMKAHELRAARLTKGWTERQAAARLGVTQAYLNYLEHGKRRLTAHLVRRAASVYGLSPTSLPVTNAFAPFETTDQHLTESLSTLGYPRFSYLRSHTPKKHPNEFLLTALSQKSLNARVAEALPWVVANSAELNSWLLENARKFNLQNRLGFVVSLARHAADRLNASSKTDELKQFEALLDDSRLAKEDYFFRPPRTERETQWLRTNRTEDAVHWNLLSDMKPEHVPYAG
jgi:transcriptional regulator with XRE-family HTH domain